MAPESSSRPPLPLPLRHSCDCNEKEKVSGLMNLKRAIDLSDGKLKTSPYTNTPLFLATGVRVQTVDIPVNTFAMFH